MMFCMRLGAMLVLSISVSLRVSAEDSPSVEPGRVVGTVYGKPITAKDVGLTRPVNPGSIFDASDEVQWDLMGRVMAAFGTPVLEKFLSRKSLSVTDEEILAFVKKRRSDDERALRERIGRLLALKVELNSPKLTEARKAHLENERAALEADISWYQEQIKSYAARDRSSEEVMKSVILSWKIERELHRMYGGRVIFQQAGFEALDGRRKLFEAAEAQGDLKFRDSGVRHLFYYYANMKHYAVDANLLEKPWFFGD